MTDFELYRASTKYLNASVSYQVNKHIQLYVQGQNLTSERQRFHLVWPDELSDTRLSERYFMLGGDSIGSGKPWSGG